MPNTITPEMSLIIPTVGQEPGPTWASDLNASLTIIDGHNHTGAPNEGVRIPSAGFNIDADLTFNGFNAIDLRSLRFDPQSVPISGVSDIGCLYESGANGDLWYNDGLGNQIQITESGSVKVPVISGPAQLIPGSNVINWALGTVFYQDVTANTIFTFLNSVSGQTIVVRLTNTGSFTVTWPGGIKWPGNVPPVLTVNKTDIYSFVNDGFNIYGTLVPNY